MNRSSIFLLLLQLQVVRVSTFMTQNQKSNVGMPSKHKIPCNSVTQLIATKISARQLQRHRDQYSVHTASTSDESAENESTKRLSTYDLGVGKNLPVGSSVNEDVNENDEKAVQSGDVDKEKIHWQVPDHPNSKTVNESLKKSIAGTYSVALPQNTEPRRVRRMVARTEESSALRGAIWHEEHYSVDDNRDEEGTPPSTSMFSPALNSNNTDTLEQDNGSSPPPNGEEVEGPFKRPDLFYPNIDLSIPPSIYNPDKSTDVVWDLMRWEAYQEAQREPLLVSFLYSSILNHDSLESSLAFLLANKLSSAAMISTQVQSLILDALDKNRSIGRAIRADIMVSKKTVSYQNCIGNFLFVFRGARC